MRKDFPFPYFYYGSSDSLDEDVLIQITPDLMPLTQETRKQFLKSLELEWELTWNTNLIVINDGIIQDTIYTKSWIDSLNNALYQTYSNHADKQKFLCPVDRLVPRNRLLAIYKAVRNILTMCTRTHYRTIVKPILNGIHPFDKKIEALKQIDFTTLDTFNQDNTADVDVWKVMAFYLGQNISLIRDGVEIYSKKDLVKHHPILSPFIYRQNIGTEEKKNFNHYVAYYITSVLLPFGRYECKDRLMKVGTEIIDMKDEVFRPTLVF